METCVAARRSRAFRSQPQDNDHEIDSAYWGMCAPRRDGDKPVGLRFDDETPARHGNRCGCRRRRRRGDRRQRAVDAGRRGGWRHHRQPDRQVKRLDAVCQTRRNISIKRRFRGAEAPFSHAAPQHGQQRAGNDPLPFCTPCHRRAA
ncbi:hypothetical protein EMIT0111MI5_100124 [Burkholderia sp. IT-111MI5]